MSRRASGSTDQYSPFEHLPVGPTDPTLADNSFREAMAGAAVASAALPAAVLAASYPAVAVAGLAVVAALLVGRATVRREEARLAREAARSRTTESAGTVRAAD